MLSFNTNLPDWCKGCKYVDLKVNKYFADDALFETDIGCENFVMCAYLRKRWEKEKHEGHGEPSGALQSSKWHGGY